jgi:hypothetical protein
MIFLKLFIKISSNIFKDVALVVSNKNIRQN